MWWIFIIVMIVNRDNTEYLYMNDLKKPFSLLMYISLLVS